MMRCCSKEQIIDRITVPKSANEKPVIKTDKEFCHICPAKLSKRELEDLYFSLLQNNLDLKKTLNRHTEKIKVLSTKLQRMTVTQKTYLGKEAKECCGTTKAVVQEQTKTIADLSRTNDQLIEQIKQLNMKLCSTKQFLKRSSVQQSPFNRATSQSTTLNGKPNSSASALHLVNTDDVTNIRMKSVSCQCLEKLLTEDTTTKSTATHVDDPTEVPHEVCDENRCRTTMEELKLKIVNLQEELLKAQSEYSLRISRLEYEVVELHEETARVRAESIARKLSLDRRSEEALEIKKQLRDTECQCGELETQLTIEQAKVAELEARVRAANRATETVRNVEAQMSCTKTIKRPRDASFAEHYRQSIRLPMTANEAGEEPLKDETDNLANNNRRGYNPEQDEIIAQEIIKKDNERDNSLDVGKETRKVSKGDSRKNMMGDTEKDKKRRNSNDTYKERKDSAESDQSSKKQVNNANLGKNISMEDPPPHKKTSVEVQHDSKLSLEARNTSKPSVVAHNVSKQSVTGHNASKPALEARRGSKQALGPGHASKQALGAHNSSKPALEARRGSKQALGGHTTSKQALEDLEAPNTLKQELERCNVSKQSLQNARKQSLEPKQTCESRIIICKSCSLIDDDIVDTSRQTDDSGYTEANKTTISEDESLDNKALAKINKALLKKIADMQTQIDKMKLSMYASTDTYTIPLDQSSRLVAPSRHMSAVNAYEKSKSQADKEEDAKNLEHANKRWQSIDDGPCQSMFECHRDSILCNKERSRHKDPDKDVIINDEQKKEIKRKDSDARYQIPGPIPVSSCHNKTSHHKLSPRDELTASELSFCRKFKAYRTKKDHLNKLDEMEDSPEESTENQSSDENKKIVEPKSKPSQEKQKDSRHCSPRCSEQKKNFHLGRDLKTSGETDSRHSRCFQENPYPGERASRSMSTQSAKETENSRAQSAKETSRSSSVQNTRGSQDSLVQAKRRISKNQEIKKMKEPPGSAHEIAEVNSDTNSLEAEVVITMTDAQTNDLEECFITKEDLREQIQCKCKEKILVVRSGCFCKDKIQEPVKQSSIGTNLHTSSKTNNVSQHAPTGTGKHPSFATLDPVSQQDHVKCTSSTSSIAQKVANGTSNVKRTSSTVNASQNATGLKGLSMETLAIVGANQDANRLSQGFTSAQHTSALKVAIVDTQAAPKVDQETNVQSRRISNASKDSAKLSITSTTPQTWIKRESQDIASLKESIRSFRDAQNETGPSLLKLNEDFEQENRCSDQCEGIKRGENESEIRLRTSRNACSFRCPLATSSPCDVREAEVDAREQPLQLDMENHADKQKCTTQIEHESQEKHQHIRRNSDCRTYSLPCYSGPVHCDRSTSPENTDQEISSLSDLPTESSATPHCKNCVPLSPGEYKCRTSPHKQVMLSIGEDRRTLDRSTETCSSSAAPAHLLSEGELRSEPYASCGYFTGTGHQSTSKLENTHTVREANDSSSAKVEAALAAISTELVRCRQLLMQTRTQENPASKEEYFRMRQFSKSDDSVKFRDAKTESLLKLNEQVETAESSSLIKNPADGSSSLMKNQADAAECSSLVKNTEVKDERRTSTSAKSWTDPERHSSIDHSDRYNLAEDASGWKEPVKDTLKKPSSCISLKHAEGKPRIGDRFTPHVMFTLHIGTVVLSDEAVINSRELSLVLTWQFYEQNVAMCRLRSGRVIPFDFSTDYDLKLTDEFLEYLKTEEMPIKICEENKLDVPFASCSLPLRGVLLLANRRMDMSLALVAGPQMAQSKRAADALDQRDELGVLDVWCMLRADPKVLPIINKSIAQSKRPSAQQSSLTRNALTQINEDDREEDMRVSAELEPPRFERRQSDWAMRDARVMAAAEAPSKANNYGYRDSANFPVYHPEEDRVPSLDLNSPELKHTRMSLQEPQTMQAGFDNRWAKLESQRRSSGIIVNEVPASIKSTLELKQALEKSYFDQPARRHSAAETAAQRISLGQASISSTLGRAKRSTEKPVTLPSVSVPRRGSEENYLNNSQYASLSMIKQSDEQSTNTYDVFSENADLNKKYDYVSRLIGGKKVSGEAGRRVTIKKENSYGSGPTGNEQKNRDLDYLKPLRSHSIDITVLWLALNEECKAMGDSNVQRLFVAYSFLGRGGAELETPISLPMPKQYPDKCIFDFKKTFQLTDSDLPVLGRMAKCRSPTKGAPNPRESVVFTVVSEPVEDPLGINNCEDIGNAHLYLGDLLAYSAGSDTYTEVIPVRATDADDIIGVLAIRVDGLDVVRKCLMLSTTGDNGTIATNDSTST